jgi:serine/threonine-protein kinase
MTPERWSRIGAIFDAALKVEPQKRSAFVADACAGDEELCLEVERMLAEDERSRGFLERPLIGTSMTTEGYDGSGSTSQTAEGDLTGKLVQGRFRIGARLGGGGMGEVFLADDPKLKRRVALKRLSPRMRSDKRFRSSLLREARRASSLNDPHIAHVYDVLEEGGEAFLLMEYIEGTTLRQRIRSPLSPVEFLDIAIQCSGALWTAHRKGVVHCDIKPENIMLTPAGQVKILDFGIAKQLPVQDAGNTTSSVELKGRFGTPNYMPPEVLAGQVPDARSDIYSLGITFYEACAGRRPGQSSLPNSTPTGAALPDRPAPPPAIELIITKMLHPDPAQRYPDAGELLRDLRSVQESRSWELTPHPAPASLLSRRWELALGAVLLLAILAWVAVTQVRPWVYRVMHPVPEQKQVAVLPFSVAGADASTKAFADGLSEVLSAKLTELTERPQFQVIPVSEVRARHVATAADARKEFGVNLVIEGTWQQAGGSVHVVPVLIDAASNRQLRANEFIAASADPIGLEAKVAAGVLKMLEIELQPEEQQAFKGQGTSESDAYARYLRGRGYLEEFAKPENIDAAISEFTGALQRDPYYARALAGLGEAYWRKYEATNDPEWSTLSKTNCERAVNLVESEATGHVCLGQVLRGTGEYEMALVQYRRALELEPTSDNAVAGLAGAYASLGNTKAAEATFRKAIALRPAYWLGYNSLGAFYFSHGRFPEAAQMFSQVVSIAPDSFRGWSNLGGAYIMEGRYAEAIEMFQRSISIRPTYAAYSNLATTFFQLRQFDDAAREYTQALQLDDRSYVVWGNLGNAYYYAGHRDRAATVLKKAVSLAQEKLKVNPRDATVLGDLASYYSMLGQSKLTLESVRQALQLAPADPAVLFDAALVYSNSRPDLALKFLDDALRHGLSISRVLHAPALDSMRNDPNFKSLLERYSLIKTEKETNKI